MLGWVTTFEGLVSGALLEASLFQKLSAFMIIQTFFVSALSGSILAEISALLEDPMSIFDLLAKSLPAQSTFFIQVGSARGLTLLLFIQNLDRTHPAEPRLLLSSFFCILYR